MEQPHEIFEKFGKELPSILLLALQFIGFRIPQHFYALREMDFETKVVEVVRKEIFEMSEGRSTNEETLQAQIYVRGKSFRDFKLPNMDIERLRAFFEAVKEHVIEWREEKIEGWTDLLTEKLKENYGHLLNGNKVVEIFEKNNDVYAKCIFPRCDANVLLTKNFYNYCSQRYERHLKTQKNHNVPLQVELDDGNIIITKH